MESVLDIKNRKEDLKGELLDAIFRFTKDTGLNVFVKIETEDDFKEMKMIRTEKFELKVII